MESRRFLTSLSPPTPSLLDTDLDESDVVWSSDFSRPDPRRPALFRNPIPSRGERERDIEREYSRSAPSRKLPFRTAPVSVPTPKRPGYADVNDDEMMIPPHEIVVRSDNKTTFSVLEGVGRTLKGRDLRQVRNAVWRQTGFLD